MYRRSQHGLEYFLVHPGGPYFRGKNAGVWTIPKGLAENSESLLETARREFFEETGIQPTLPFTGLGSVTQKNGKIVHAWAFEGAWEPAAGIVCNSFTLEWPPRSGRKAEFPEVDKAAWFVFEDAVHMIIAEQIPFIEKLKKLEELR